MIGRRAPCASALLIVLLLRGALVMAVLAWWTWHRLSRRDERADR